MEVSKDSKFTFSLETLISLAVTIFMVVGMWFTLQADIKEAKEIKEQQKEMREDVKNIERMMMQK